MKTIIITCLSLLGLVIVFIISENEELIQQPNIVFIFADDWGYGDLGLIGHPHVKTPNIDQLAEEGTQFRQFYVTSGVCSPSRASVITGHFPVRHRVHGHFAGNDVNERRDMPNWLDPNVVSLPRLLKQEGYMTAHFGKWHLGGGGEPHGDLTAPEPKYYGYDSTRVWNGNGPTWKGTQLWPTTRYMDNDWEWVPNSSMLAVNETIKFIEANQAQPFFVNLWLKDPHTPLKPTQEQRKAFSHLSEPEQTYYSVLHDADHHIGRLLDAIDSLGLKDNTIVIFSSDNGPEEIREDWGTAGGTARLRGRKRSLYEGGVRTPFIVRWPGQTPSDYIDSLSVLSSVDLLPTFVHLAGGELPGDYVPDGEDIMEALKGNSFKRSKPLYWEWRFGVSGDQDNHAPNMAIRENRWKFFMNFDGSDKELYDIIADPQESINLVERYLDIVDSLSRKLLKWKKSISN